MEHVDIAWNRNGARGYSVGLSGKCGYKIHTAGGAYTKYVDEDYGGEMV